MIVVIGAAGVIGRAVTARLHAAGAQVLPITRGTLDLAGGESLASILDSRPDGVIHLAAAVPGVSARLDTEETAAITRRIDRCVYDAVAAWQCPVVYASGCSLYDRRFPTFLTEEGPLALDLTSPYLRAKAEGERLFLTFGTGIIARIAGLIGKGLPSHVVARRFVSAAASGGTIELWGSGAREQDFVNIDDIAAALVAALGATGRSIFNISTSEPVTMLDLARKIIATLGRGAYAFSHRPDPQERDFARFDNTRARELLGWSPQTTLTDSILSMLEDLP